MGKVLAIVGLLSMFGLTAVEAQKEQQPAAGEVCTLKVSGMACGACAERVEKTAKEIDGVKAAKVDQPKGRAEITFDPAKTSPEAIAKTITEKTAFKAEVIPKEKK